MDKIEIIISDIYYKRVLQVLMPTREFESSSIEYMYWIQKYLYFIQNICTEYIYVLNTWATIFFYSGSKGLFLTYFIQNLKPKRIKILFLIKKNWLERAKH